MSTVPRLSRSRPGCKLARAVPILALLLAGFAPAAQAQSQQVRWVHGPGEPTQCGAIPGYSTLHAALEGVDPLRPVTVYVSRNYQHQAPAGGDPRVVISDRHAAPGGQGQVRLLGGRTCVAGTIPEPAEGARTRLVSVQGGRILLVMDARSVLIEDMEFRGARGAPTGSHPALHVSGPASAPESTKVTLRRVIVADNVAAEAGAAIVTNATVDIEGAQFIDNRGGEGAALLALNAAVVMIRADPGSSAFATTRFENNVASGSAGAIQLRRSNVAEPRLILDGSGHPAAPAISFIGNTAAQKGGAIELDAGANLEIIGNVRFEANSALQGGAISVFLDAANAAAARLRIEPDAGGRSATFFDNEAGQQGGAIHCSTNDENARDRPAIALGPTWFRGNRAQFRGGAIHLDGCRLSSVAGPGTLTFTQNEVYGGYADTGPSPLPRGGGALFVTRAVATLGASGEFPTAFGNNRVRRVDAGWGHHCGTQFCVLRGLSGGAVMLFDGAGHFYNSHFADNVAPFGGAIAAVDATLTVDQAGSGCDDPQGCSRFFRNRANGAAYNGPDANAGRARRGYGAAIAVRNDRADPATGLHRTVRIQRTRFTDNGTGCTSGMSCALDPERLLRGRVIQANVPDGGQLIVRGNLFANNAQPDDVPNSAAQADDAEVSLYRRPPTAGEPRPVLLALNTFWKDAHCPGAPWLVDVRDSTGQAGRIDVAANLLLGCTGNRNFTAQAQTAFGVYACNIASAPAPGQAVVRGHNQQQPAAGTFFADAGAGDFRLRDNVFGASATDICGNEIAGQSIVNLLQSLGADLGGQPRPVRFGGGLVPEAGDWDVGAYERQPAPAQPLIFADGFE